jgi:hypothetical protein
LNLGTLRTRVFQQADWQPTQSTNAKTRVNEFINRAIEQISLEAPQLFFTEDLAFRCQPDVEPFSSSDTVSIESADNWVVSRDATSATSGYTAWTTDGTWDGRWIAITDGSTGEVIHRQIREVWSYSSGNVVRQRLTIYEPWPSGADTTAMTYRIYTPRYPLPADIIRLRHARLRRYTAGTFDYPLEVVGEVQAEDAMFEASPGTNIESNPRFLYRRGFFQLDSPKDTATCALNQAVTWLGPEPPGTFTFVYTYIWGLRHELYQGPNSWNASASGRKVPLYESAPSPASSSIAATGLDGAIVVTTPNIDFEQGFGVQSDSSANTLPRYQRSGWRKRIYVKRSASNFTNYSGLTFAQSGLATISTVDDYLLLGEVDGSTEAFTWRGDITPDRLQRLKDYAGNQMVALWPRPSEADTVLLNVVRRPQPLADDQDAPRLVPEAGDLIVSLAGAFLAEMEGQTGAAAAKRAWYKDHLKIVADQYGDLRPQNRPIYRKTLRARKGGGPYRNWPSEVDFDR